jgi:MFS family permease
MWFSAKSQLIPLPSECKKLILLNALFQGGRLFVGAVCVLYFLSFGLQTGDYAWIKTTQAIIFIGLDIPLGYFLSRMGEYKSLLISVAFGVVGALGYLLFTTFFGFLVSETFLALSLSTWPVALSAYSMRVLENYKIEGLAEKFFHFGDAVSNLFVVVCGSLGGLFYAFNKYIPYSCLLIFYLLAVVFTLLYLKDFGVIKVERKERIKFVISNIKEMGTILPFASILFLAQFFMQPLFHYWQPLFGEKFSISSKDMSIVFVCYSLAMSTISWGYSRMTHLSILRSNLFVASAGLIGSLVYSLIARLDNFSFSLIFFALSFGIYNLMQIAAGVLIQNRLKQENRMIITKYVSFYSRIGMIVSLIVLHWLFANEWGTSGVYKLYGGLATLSFCLYLGLMMMQKNAEKKYVSESKG